MKINEEEYLAHYGTPRHSGRYPWGSGGNTSGVHDPRNASFLDHVDNLSKQGLSEKEIAQGMGLSIAKLRAQKSVAKNEKKQAQIAMVERLAEKGMGNVAIGKQTGLPESTVREYLKPGAKLKSTILESTVKKLQMNVDDKGITDIGRGQEHYLGVSTNVLNNAVSVLEQKGYVVHKFGVEQLGTGKQTNLKVLAPPGTTYGEAIRAKNSGNIHQITDFSPDRGESWIGIKPPLPVSIDRVSVVYGDQGGSKADGVIFVRPGVKDVSLDGAKYAQVRVQVGEDHYLKGMAMCKDGLPEGTDLLFNTSKKDTGDKKDALKPLDKENPDNPFGATLSRQITDEHDRNKVTSAMNIVNEEGDWLDWQKSIATQVLSKQSPTLAKAQLSMTYEDRLADFKSISELTNPTVKRKMLLSFADSTDAAAVHLKAAQLPRMGWHVILPMDSLPPTHVYAPNYRDGEPVVLIRYPHGGTFEIPKLVVDNQHAPAKKLLGNARDAVAVHPKVAEQLSGADFDGDTVLVIPNAHGKIRSTSPLEQLKDFNPKQMYPKYDGMHVMTKSEKGMEMGKISNLITDMTIRGASHEDISRAIKHSMVVIDAEKWELNYKQSYIDNGIANLKDKYQGAFGFRGASTIISRASAEVRVPHRQERRMSRGGPIDPLTGKRVFEETGRINFKTGKPVQTISKQLAEEEDAHRLSSDTPMENLYADHSNKLKGLANTARLEYLKTPHQRQSKTAKQVYSKQVEELKVDLALAERNAPLERQAQIIANSMVKARRDANPNMDNTTLKKIRNQAQELARARTGAKKQQIEITPTQWEAIQAGAISEHMLTRILDNANLDIVKELARPNKTVLMTQTKITNAKMLLANGATRAEVAARLGVSISTLDKALAGS